MDVFMTDGLETHAVSETHWRPLVQLINCIGIVQVRSGQHNSVLSIMTGFFGVTIWTFGMSSKSGGQIPISINTKEKSQCCHPPFGVFSQICRLGTSVGSKLCSITTKAVNRTAS